MLSNWISLKFCRLVKSLRGNQGDLSCEALIMPVTLSVYIINYITQNTYRVAKQELLIETIALVTGVIYLMEY